MKSAVISLIIGYLCGSFLTAEVVARIYAGKKARELGETGNPGMANIMASLGFVPGILTLAGDLLKCILAAGVSLALFPGTGRSIILYAGLGCTLGHDFPFWQRFRGGKGVATTSMVIALYAFVPGLSANLIGLLTVLVTKYLCIGGPVIPLSFTVMMLFRGDIKAVGPAVVLTALSLLKHGPAILGVRSGRTGKTDVIGAIRKKTGRKQMW